MKPISLLAAFFVLTACSSYRADRLLSGNQTLNNIEVTVEEFFPDGFPGLTIRAVSFVNNGSSPVSVSGNFRSRSERLQGVDFPAIFHCGQERLGLPG